MCASVNDDRRGDGGRGDNRGSTEKVEFWPSKLKVMAGLIDLLRSALLLGTPRATGPTPRPTFRPARVEEVVPIEGELALSDCNKPRLDAKVAD